ncbi:MAG: (2Fe-2S)-binding protein, partial [Deltaproteobacteria bacterium]|nr:(2Fe-2S)-binding protein [Deltaproteobacteria bacterium]
MEKINVTIDDTRITVEKGTTVLEAARSAGIYIP